MLANKKDIGIPNSYPFKDKILDDVMREKEQAKEAKRQKRAEKKKKSLNKDDIQDDIALRDADAGLAEVHVGSILKEQEPNPRAERRQRQLLLRKEDKKSKKEYLEELQKIVEEADIFFEVLDARDPLDCRLKDLEIHLTSKGKGKRIVLILNKIDLIPL